jgi:glycine cleavage system regulatory protein
VIWLGDAEIASKMSVNVIGAIYKSKLNWCEQVSSAVMKANISFNTIELIRKYFSTTKLLRLVTILRPGPYLTPVTNPNSY